jgi:hypothetical protein
MHLASRGNDRRGQWGRWSVSVGFDLTRAWWKISVNRIRWLGVFVILIGCLSVTVTKPVRFEADRFEADRFEPTRAEVSIDRHAGG